jgi:hypothetical protein
MRVGVCKVFAYYSVKLVLLADGNRDDLDYNILRSIIISQLGFFFFCAHLYLLSVTAGAISWKANRQKSLKRTLNYGYKNGQILVYDHFVTIFKHILFCSSVQFSKFTFKKLCCRQTQSVSLQ